MEPKDQEIEEEVSDTERMRLLDRVATDGSVIVEEDDGEYD